MTSAAPNTDDVRRYLNNLKGEIDGAALYRLLAATEKKPLPRLVFVR